jgi:hypothetical protein
MWSSDLSRLIHRISGSDPDRHMAYSESNKEILPEGELLRLNEWGEALGWLLAGFVFLLGVVFVTVFVPWAILKLDPRGLAELGIDQRAG